MKRTIKSGLAGSTSQVFGGVVIVIGILGGNFMASPSWSAGFKSPEECLAYSGDAHLNCLYAYIEIQQDTISKLEEKVRSQQKTAQELQDRVKLQDLWAQVLDRKVEDRKDKSREHQFQWRRPYAGFYYRFGGPYYYDPYFGPPFGYSYGSYYPWW